MKRNRPSDSFSGKPGTNQTLSRGKKKNIITFINNDKNNYYYYH